MTEKWKCSHVMDRWCPVHGECTCEEDFGDAECPLHGEDSQHGTLPGTFLACVTDQGDS